MADREAELALARHLSRLLILIGDRAKAEYADAVASFGLPVPTTRALLVLRRPTRMSELAEELGCNASYVTGLADELQERGLIARVTGADRRVKLLKVTERGAALRERIAAAVSDSTMITRLLTDSEQATLRPLLERLLERFDDAGTSAAQEGDAS